MIEIYVDVTLLWLLCCNDLNFQTFFTVNQFYVSGKKLKSNMHAGGGANSNPVRSILVCLMCKRCNPIQSALKLLKGTICVTQWITFFDDKQCHWTSFQVTMYQSIPSLTIPPPERPPGNRTFSLPGRSGFRPTFFGVLNKRKFLQYSFERKMQEFLDLFRRNRRQLEKQVLSCCIESIFAKKDSKCLLYL